MVVNKLKLQSILSAVVATAATLSVVVPTNAQNTIKIDGSSTVYPITEAAAEEFQKANNVRVTVGISGTGGGFKKFCAGETDISDASRPIKEKEQKLCAEKGVEYIEIPVAYDAITVVVNKNNNFASDMSKEELKAMWSAESEDKINRWSQLRDGWTYLRFKLYGPGADSGTFDYFNEKILKKGGSRTDYTPSEDDNVLVQGVSRSRNALGYFGLAYYLTNQDKLKAVTIDGEEALLPDGKINPDYALARPIFIYVKKSALSNSNIKSFVEYYLENAPRLVKKVQYVPLSSEAYGLVSQRFQAGTTGTVFQGAKGTVEEILSRQ